MKRKPKPCQSPRISRITRPYEQPTQEQAQRAKLRRRIEDLTLEKQLKNEVKELWD